MVYVLRNGHDDRSSNLGEAVFISQSVHTLTERYSVSSNGQIVAKTALFNVDRTTGLSEQ